MARKLMFELEDHGVDHAQYFTGRGVSGTDYNTCDLGVGESAREAAEDALQMMYQGADDLEGIDLSELEAEIAALSEDYDAHKECLREIGTEYDAGKLRSKPREWMVTRQRPWNGEPAEEYVEISSGRESFSPGALAGSANIVGPLSDPAEVIAEARTMAERVNKDSTRYTLPIYFGDADLGGGGEDDFLSAEQLKAWADKRGAEVEQARTEAVEAAHEECELHHYVSIRYSIVDE
jgi:hypothetical protein